MTFRVLVTTMRNDRDRGRVEERHITDSSLLYIEIANKASDFIRNNPDGRVQVRVDTESEGEWVVGNWVEYAHNGKWLLLLSG